MEKTIMLDGSDINKFIELCLISIDKNNEVLSEQTIDEDGLYSFISKYDNSPVEQVKKMKESDIKIIRERLIKSGMVTIHDEEKGKPYFIPNCELSPIEFVIIYEYVESFELN